MRNRHYAGLMLSLASLVVLLCINFDLHLKQDAPISSGPATTGKEFDGQKFRTFDKKLVADFAVGAIFSDDSIEKYAGKMCEKWAVMTTITSPASEALRRFLYKMDWCVVVVGDINGPQDFGFESSMGSNIFFLSSNDQSNLNNKFVNALPWGSFGRKNVGYLYAIARGAKVIWDFDDDNILKFWMNGASVDPFVDIETFANVTMDAKISEPVVDDESLIVFNPYPILGADNTWPRGLPLGQIRNKAWSTATLGEPETSNLGAFGVIQSLADIQPDVDAVFRMSQTTLFMYKKKSKLKDTILKIPSHLVVPYNAQSTLHYYDAFWTLFLPVTVPGRVSDIWRSFAAQGLLKKLDLSVGYLPRPLVVQERNLHSNEADFVAELPLYIQSHAFCKLISEKYLKSNDAVIDLPRAIESLWIDIYERGFIEIQDVFLVQKWIKALKSIGYIFPESSASADDVRLTVDRKMLIEAGTPLNEMNEKLIKKLNSNACTDSPQLTFGLSDIHEGPRADIPSILTHLGQRVVMMGEKGNVTNYPEVLNNPNVIISREMSATLANYNHHSHPITNNDIKENTKFYQESAVMKSIDAFVCTFPASMCQLWNDLGKSIVFLPAHRYNLGRCTPKDWKLLDSEIKNMTMNPDSSHTVGAMSRYDAEYLRYYTGIPINIISSLSFYYTNSSSYHKPTKLDILIFCLREGARDFIRRAKMALSPEIRSEFVYDLYNTYTLDDLSNHPAIVMLPYSVMSYRLTELYSLKIPLFIPSPKFYLKYYDPDTKKIGLGHDRTSTSEPYCKNYKGLEGVMRPAVESGLSSHPYSPNIDMAEGPESEMYWLQFSDFYDWAHIQLFDDFKDLKRKISTADFIKISENMGRESEIRRMQVDRKWCGVFERIKKNQKT